jgi:hypothetical protein
VKHLLFSCDQCGVQATQDPEWKGAPHGWAVIQYARDHDVPVAFGNASDTVRFYETQVVTTTSTTYACGDCAQRVLDSLESKAPKQETKVA